MYQIWALYHKLCHENGHTLVIWLESYERLYMIGLFVNDFFGKFVKTQVYHFSQQLVHIKGLHAKGFIFLNFSSFSLIFFKIGSKSSAHQFIAKTQIFQQHVWILHRMLLYYLKMNFGDIQEQTITHLQFKFELLSGNRL